MKKLIAIIILVLAIPQAHAKHYPSPPPSFRWIRSVPILIEPIEAGLVPAFWAAVSAVCVLVDVLEEMAEPLDSFETGIQHVTGATSATISWPDGEYPTRDIDAERVYDYDPVTKKETWFIKVTFKVLLSDGTWDTSITYSQDPPVVRDFNNEDVHYNRIGLSGNHESTFSYDAFEIVTAYCYNRGTRVWPRPVMSFLYGGGWIPVWRNDIMYHSPVDAYVDQHYLLIPRGGVALYKPHWVEQTEFYSTSGVSTLFFEP